MQMRKKFLSTFLLIGLAVLEPGASAFADGNLTVHFLDVGQGLSVLLQSDGHYALYDGGDREYASRVVSYLEDAGVQSLDYVIASHYDADHLNGLVGALNAFPANAVLGPDYTRETSVYRSFLEAVDGQGLSVQHPSVGSTYELGSSTFTVLAPSSDSYEDGNNYSIVLRLAEGDDVFLLMGDAESDSEEEILASGLDVACDVLCVGHHGSASSTTWDFLEQALPESAVISCGLENDYGHPHTETMEKLESMEISLFRTDLQGDLTAYTEGSGIAWNTDPCNVYTSGSDTVSSYSMADAADYILNTNTGKFHLPSCQYADKIKEENRLEYVGSREGLIEEGYEPCKRCNP
ncbi:MAG: MBL fold metallo-hydrolase [Eubacteriales bacterium]|nr:MBL fold metallo-hydrolase [Eubacteriales bacterium]